MAAGLGASGVRKELEISREWRREEVSLPLGRRGRLNLMRKGLWEEVAEKKAATAILLYLARDGNNGDTVQGVVNETTNQVRGSWPGSSNAHSKTARGAGIAFRSKNSTLLVTRLDISDSFGVGEGQVYLNGSSSRVCKDMAHDLPLKGLHENIDAFAGFIGAKTGDESSGGRVGKGGGGTSNGSR
ncbi:hypothetical protein CRG98_046322, partial [Punica granatum]